MTEYTKLSRTVQRIVEHLRMHGEATPIELASKLDLGIDNVRFALGRATKTGYVHRVALGVYALTADALAVA